jgi:hypothetical protein
MRELKASAESVDARATFGSLLIILRTNWSERLATIAGEIWGTIVNGYRRFSVGQLTLQVSPVVELASGA